MRAIIKIVVLSMMAALLMVGVSVASAQRVTIQRDDVFVSPAGDWQVTIPRGYEIEVDRDDIGIVTGDGVEMQLISPTLLDDMGYGRIDETGELIEAYADDEGYDITEPDDGNTDPTFFLALLTDNRTSLIGVAKLFSDETVALALVEVDDNAPDDVFTEITEIINSWDVAEADNGGGSKDPNNAVTSDLPGELRDFDADWEDAIAELEDENIIDAGGELIFFEDLAFVQSNGFTYTPLASRAREQNVIVAGELTFEPDGNDFETCSLAARVIGSDNGGTDIFMEIGFDNDRNTYVYDVFDTGDEDTFFYNPSQISRGDTHHFLALIIDETIALYVDGELVTEEPLEVTEREGSFGIMMRSDSSNSRCEGRNIWAYTVPR
ncbi:MAG: hypothetical protein H7Y11_08475 [Armatimonadetes bacterium]|nr:hypothetical protein [Anaerolineae bacterium]